jgi:predicted nucleic acid-binding protein
VKVLIDSDILVEVARGKDSELIARWLGLSQSAAKVLYSPVSVAELWAGARPSEREVLNRLFGALTCVSIGQDVGRQAGAYLRQHSKRHGVEVPDALIAATAVENCAELWTRNRKHYPMKEVLFFTA